MKLSGKLYGIGVGPGAPDLITLRGYNLLKETRYIAFPEATKGSGSYAKNIIDSLINKEEKELIPLTFPMTRDPAVLEKEWGKSVETLLEPLSNGENVIFVSEGDPLFYSTFIHLMEKMKAASPDLKVEIVPGISALHGAAASLGWGLVNADQKFAVIPATDNEEDMVMEIDRHDTVVFYKAAKVIKLLTEIFRKKDLLPYAAAVSKATSPDEKIFYNLEEIPEEGMPYLSLVILRKPEKIS